MRTGRFSRLLGSCAALLVLWPDGSLKANLVICLERNDALYVAADAFALSPAAGGPVRSSRVFKLDDTCCVCITGFGGPVLMDTNASRASVVFFPVELEQMCVDGLQSGEMLRTRINRIITHFGARYHDCLRNRRPPEKGTPADSVGTGTRIAFVGYDGMKREFFGTSYRYSETNRAVMEPVFGKSPTNSLGRLSFQGATGFLEALISGEAKLPAEPAEEFRKIVTDIYGAAPLSEPRVIECLLELFRLHRQYSAELGFGNAAIEEPFSIYKITRDVSVRIR